MSSTPELPTINRAQSAREGTAPRAPGTRPAGQSAAAISIRFGSFCLWPVRRLLLRDNQPVHIGSRALEILITLVERAGDLVTKQELMARVWPTTFVEPANLTVHITRLRRALGDDRDGNCFLINIPGRGYRFVAPVTVSDQFNPSLGAASVAGQTHNLPARVTRLIGRGDIVADLSVQIARDRVISVVGQGGVGKTAVALAVAERAAASFTHGTWWIDLAASENPQHVAGAIASALGFELGRGTPPGSLVTALRDMHMLLVLDTCEHVITAVAGLVAALLREAPGVHVLATSREPLYTEGEQVCRLAGLETAPADCASAEQALGFPAIALFVERATASAGKLTLGETDVAVVSHVCSKLEGIPLAIEHAARRFGSFGIGEFAARLDQPQVLLTSGYRTGPARQRTMHASADWSHDLLTDTQKVVFRRLAIFADDFSLRDALNVVSDRTHTDSEIVDEIAELVAKSLLASEIKGAQLRFRLPHITRAYALQKLREYGELEATARRLTESLKLAVSRTSAVGTLADRGSTYSMRGERSAGNDGDAPRRRANDGRIGKNRSASHADTGRAGDISPSGPDHGAFKNPGDPGLVAPVHDGDPKQVH